MNKLQYQLLTMLSRQEQTTEDIYSYLPDLAEAHIVRTLNSLKDQGLCDRVGTFKRDPGNPGRPMSVYGITAQGKDALSAEDEHLAHLRGG